MSYPSESQILEAAKRLSIKEGGALVRTNGLWHVLMFLRHRACHGMKSEYTFEAYDLAEAAFDLNGVTLPIADDSRNVYFEPGATQGREIVNLFRHRDGPRQTYLNRIYTGLVGNGPRRPTLFQASSISLPTKVNLVDDWIVRVRKLGDNQLILDDNIQYLVTWIFRFGVPHAGQRTATIAKHSSNGRLERNNAASCDPIPNDHSRLRTELAAYFGLDDRELHALFPRLNQIDPSYWNSTGSVPFSIGSKIPSYLTDECIENSGNADLSRLVHEFKEAAVGNAGLLWSNGLIHRFLSSLLSKRFLVLTGLAGSGKTKLAQAFARWITPAPAWEDPADHLKGKLPNPHYQLVPVGADWTGNENVVGYPDGLNNGNYVSKPALQLIRHALEPANKDIPHFLILDEMNLSHVERYFADILSAIESAEKIPLYDGGVRSSDGHEIPKRIALPENFFIIGTVNVDETTYMFSPKVLDRANVIEFRMSMKELDEFLQTPVKPDLSELDGQGYPDYGKTISDTVKSDVAIPDDAAILFRDEAKLFFQVLQAHGAEFGYRVIHEAARFVCFYHMLGNYQNHEGWFREAFDCVIVQKILPKLNGSRAKLGPLLKSLWILCVTPDPVRSENLIENAQDAARSTDKKSEPTINIPPNAPYPISAEKIGRMWRLLRDNGFASFAEA